jgi:hypothetical protein
MRTRTVENRRDRMEMAAEAGYPRVSFVSVLAGVLVAYGAFAIVAGLTGAVLNALGVDTRALSDNDWRQLGIGTGVAVAVSLFLSYLFGGYVAGRMARRAGALNGLLVFVLGILLAAGVGAAIGSQADAEAIRSNLRSIGVPTSGSEYSAIGTIAGLAALASMLFGSILGGILGERWHGKLLARALDPTVGPEHVRTEGDRDVDLTDRTAVRSTGQHFLTTDDDDADRTAVAQRIDDEDDAELDVHPRTREHRGDLDTTLDEERAAERTRTIRN